MSGIPRTILLFAPHPLLEKRFKEANIIQAKNTGEIVTYPFFCHEFDNQTKNAFTARNITFYKMNGSNSVTDEPQFVEANANNWNTIPHCSTIYYNVGETIHEYNSRKITSVSHASNSHNNDITDTNNSNGNSNSSNNNNSNNTSNDNNNSNINNINSGCHVNLISSNINNISNCNNNNINTNKNDKKIIFENLINGMLSLLIVLLSVVLIVFYFFTFFVFFHFNTKFGSKSIIFQATTDTVCICVCDYRNGEALPRTFELDEWIKKATEEYRYEHETYCKYGNINPQKIKKRGKGKTKTKNKNGSTRSAVRNVASTTRAVFQPIQSHPTLPKIHQITQIKHVEPSLQSLNQFMYGKVDINNNFVSF